MNLYHCFIDLRDEAKALAFAHAVEGWMEHLKRAGTIRAWRLLRRKLNLAADAYSDFMLEIEVEDLAALDRAFRMSGSRSEEVDRLLRQITPMIARSRFALYRPFPDPERVERMALL